MRNTFLITAVLFCMATAALAANQKKDAQPQSQSTERAQMASNNTGGSMDHASSARSNCAPKPEEHSKRKHQQDDPEGDPQASQNQVEYGGGG